LANALTATTSSEEAVRLSNEIYMGLMLQSRFRDNAGAPSLFKYRINGQFWGLQLAQEAVSDKFITTTLLLSSGDSAAARRMLSVTLYKIKRISVCCGCAGGYVGEGGAGRRKPIVHISAGIAPRDVGSPRKTVPHLFIVCLELHVPRTPQAELLLSMLARATPL
jgi:hypothetical protein